MCDLTKHITHISAKGSVAFGKLTFILLLDKEQESIQARG